ncbi:hypothetical protein [Sulfurimonas sp. NWX367]|uniref:hypothetical protein n=1 Tax=Sulfurimonas sp. NWX367 TaxID=2925413 RepID=UPI003204BB3B
MSINEIHNQKILEFIHTNKCDLSNANLSELNANLFNFKNIEELILSDNKLTTISKEIKKLQKLKWLSLSDNPNLELNAEQKSWLKTLQKNGCKILYSESSLK